MQRYFCNSINNNDFILNSNDSYHIKKVMRMSVNDTIEIVHDKKLYISKIISLDNCVQARVMEIKNDYNELDVRVSICQSLVNEQKMDLILQKCTELGAYDFYPYKSFNSIIKDNGKSDKKVSRWQSIVKEASEQSKRNIIPLVHDYIDINELIKLDYSLKLICTVNELTQNIKTILQRNNNCDTMLVVIGPEGGFKPLEEKKLIDNGFIPASLGKRVLRTETASLSILSMINYEWMVK